MTHVVRALIPAFWILWLGYWVIAARSVRETRRRESLTSRVTHYGPMILGGAILGFPNILGQELEGRFHQPTEAWLWFATTMVAIGLAFSAVARAWLGTNWSSDVTVKQDHELIRSGPYALVRHPIYTSVLLALAGSVLAVGKWRALVGLALVVAGLLRKLVVEERFMTEQFGKAYAQYRAEVPALIPFVV